MGKYGLHGGEKPFLLFQLRAYHGYSKEDLAGKTIKQLRPLMYSHKNRRKWTMAGRVTRRRKNQSKSTKRR